MGHEAPAAWPMAGRQRLWSEEGPATAPQGSHLSGRALAQAQAGSSLTAHSSLLTLGSCHLFYTNNWPCRYGLDDKAEGFLYSFEATHFPVSYQCCLHGGPAAPCLCLQIQQERDHISLNYPRSESEVCNTAAIRSQQNMLS